MSERGRLDAELVRRGLARSRRHAGELIGAGRVRVDGSVVTRSAAGLGPDQAVVVEGAPAGAADPGYASRAGHKLAGALDALGSDEGSRPSSEDGAGSPRDPAGGVSRGGSPGPAVRGPAVRGRWCLDAGASTGGFTDVLLRRGATHVVAVDVGHGQLDPRLRDDPRVTVREGVNVRYLTPHDVHPRPDLVVGDLSFISLTLVLPALSAVAAPGADLLLMVKPQFEVGRERLGSGGVVRDPALRVTAVLGVAEVAVALGLRVRAAVASPLPGPHGNVEYFLWMSVPVDGHAGVGGTGQDEVGHDAPVTDLRGLVEAAVAAGPTGARPADGPTDGPTGRPRRTSRGGR